MKFLRLTAPCLLLFLVACDATQEPGASSVTLSPLDGQPIVSLSAQAFASGEALRQARDQIARTVGSEIVAALQESAAAKTSSDGSATVLLKDAVAPVSKKSGVELPSSHYAVDLGNGYTEEMLLTLVVAEAQGMASKDGGSAFLVEDPDLTQADGPQDRGGSITLEAVSLNDPSQTATVSLASGSLEVVGDPSASVVMLTAMPIIDGSNSNKALAPGEPCEVEADCAPTGGGGPGTGGLPSFPSYMISQKYLALRTLRIDTRNDGGSAEVQMHLRPNDNYTSDQFVKKNEYRFDNNFVSSVVSSLFAHSYSTYLLYGPSGGPAPGTVNAWNPVILEGISTTRWYNLPDVNHPNQDYDFTNLATSDWIWNISPNTGLYDGSGANEDGFPLHALTSTSWRAVVVEDDNDVRHFVKLADGDWEGDVQTYDFGSGSASSVYTETDSDWTGWANDDPFLNSGYRRASLQNAQQRVVNGTIQTNVNGFKYTFQIRDITS